MFNRNHDELQGVEPLLFTRRDCAWLVDNGIDYREWSLLVKIGKVAPDLR